MGNNMKNVAVIGLVSVLGLGVMGCSAVPFQQTTQMVENVEQEDNVDSGLMSLYEYLVSRGDNVSIESTVDYVAGDRGYFRFNDDNDVHYDEVIIGDDYVIRYRDGVEQTLTMGSFNERIVGDHYIKDHDPR